MTRRVTRTLAGLALAVAVVAAGPLGPAAAQDCDGVLVVVDATGAGGGVTHRCALGEHASGLAALEAAGHAYTFVPRQPGMVCTIDGLPEPCAGPPALDAYWSYWWATDGGVWTYATRGAAGHQPARGDAEGWRFGDGSEPPPPPDAEAAVPTPGDPSATTVDPPDDAADRGVPAPGLLIGALLIVAVGVSAILQARRRRSP